MKLLGHTLGTPDATVGEALTLFSKAGLDGAEIVWQDGYLAGLGESDGAAVEEARHIADDLGLTIGVLTPYISAINSLDDAERTRDLDRFRRCIDVAARLGATRVRVYSGFHGPDDTRPRATTWERLVASLRLLGGYAADRGIVLCCENHFSTMTVSAAETARLIAEIDSPAVRALYDQANLTFTHQEDFEEAIELQRGVIGHVHIKDLVFTDPDRPFVASAVHTISDEERAVRSRVVGDGILDWPAILARLLQTGYQGDASLEYEYRWHRQDLRPPEEGFRVGANRIRGWLSDLAEEEA